MDKTKIKINEAKTVGETIQEEQLSNKLEFIESSLVLLVLQKERVLFFHTLSNKINIVIIFIFVSSYP